MESRMTLDMAWARACRALTGGTRIVTTEHVDHDFAFAAIRSDEKVRNVIAYDGTPDWTVVAWGADVTPIGALLDLADHLEALKVSDDH